MKQIKYIVLSAITRELEKQKSYKRDDKNYSRRKMGNVHMKFHHIAKFTLLNRLDMFYLAHLFMFDFIFFSFI